MYDVDVLIIGGGILGCFAARNLCRWQLSAALVEQREDVCTGITRANSAIAYAGYDNRPGSRKAAMTVQGNRAFGQLCRELDVPFHRCGSLLVSWDTGSTRRLEQKYQSGRINGVPGLELLSGAQARAMEPMLTHQVQAALYAPTTGTVNPWQLGIAAWENAKQNGLRTFFRQKVQGISRENGRYLVKTEEGCFRCAAVLNCAGLSSDEVEGMLFPGGIQLHLDGAEYLVLDAQTPKPGRVIFHQAQSCGKGITAVPCVEGNLLLSGVRRPLEVPYATTAQGLDQLYDQARALLPSLDLSQVIRSFAAVRPNPVGQAGQSIGDFVISHPAPGFYSLIGIKTPGLTCADQLGSLLAEAAAGELGANENPAFDPIRRAIPAGPGRIVCQCQHITEEQILEAIRRGAVSVEGVKRRLGTGMGRCQGSRCGPAIGKLLWQQGLFPEGRGASFQEPRRNGADCGKEPGNDG